MARTKQRRLAPIGLALAGLVAALLVFVKLRYGGGRPYPDVSTEPLVPAGQVETLVEHPLPLGNVATSRGGRIFYNTHPFTQSQRFTDAFVFELVGGKPRPYPDL
ncbi:MAG: hypothetical protein MUF34_32385, partial [Polyangiaceae bacterium]|nr:hypothetical protein [Polyangiaceae bacterium]